MIIIGCDYHPGVQQIAWVDTDTGEFQEARLCAAATCGTISQNGIYTAPQTEGPYHTSGSQSGFCGRNSFCCRHDSPARALTLTAPRVVRQKSV